MDGKRKCARKHDPDGRDVLFPPPDAMVVVKAKGYGQDCLHIRMRRQGSRLLADRALVKCNNRVK